MKYILSLGYFFHPVEVLYTKLQTTFQWQIRKKYVNNETPGVGGHGPPYLLTLDTQSIQRNGRG